MIKAEWTNKDALDLQPTCNKLATNVEPKTGKWVKRQTIGDVNFAYCSECGEPILHGRTSPLWNFCPNCGARMKGGDTE